MNTLSAARIASSTYGLVALAGGTMGFVSAGSKASLIAGGISGLLLLAAAALMPRKTAIGLVLALLVSLALVGRFAPAALQTQKPVALVMSLGGLVVALLAVRAFLRSRQATSSP